MTALVTYDSSSEDEDNTELERPSKRQISKTEVKPSTQDLQATVKEINPGKSISEAQETPSQPHRNIQQSQPAQGPIAGPNPFSSTAQETSSPEGPGDSTTSSYAFERQRLRDLTMPTVPNFDIPDSPPPPPANSEEAAMLAATAKKLQHFLELKKQGVHFNERLKNSTSLRNPSLLPNLMEFAGITQADSYASSLTQGLAVPTEWPDECYTENLIKHCQRSQKKKLTRRDRVDFVSSTKPTTPSANKDVGDSKKREK